MILLFSYILKRSIQFLHFMKYAYIPHVRRNRGANNIYLFVLPYIFVACSFVSRTVQGFRIRAQKNTTFRIENAEMKAKK